MTREYISTALETAEESYRTTFGEFAPVWGFMANPRLAEELDNAVVARGKTDRGC